MKLYYNPSLAISFVGINLIRHIYGERVIPQPNVIFMLLFVCPQYA